MPEVEIDNFDQTWNDGIWHQVSLLCSLKATYKIWKKFKILQYIPKKLSLCKIYNYNEHIFNFLLKVQFLNYIS